MFVVAPVAALTVVRGEEWAVVLRSSNGFSSFLSRRRRVASYIKALADHVDAALLPSTASRKLPEWVAKLQDAVALNCCKGDASGERGAAQ